MGGAYIASAKWMGDKLFHLNPFILVQLCSQDSLFSRRPIKFYNFFFAIKLSYSL
jgi:hypothetical protein